MILPIRSRVWFDEDGAVAGTDRWARSGSRRAAASTASSTWPTPPAPRRTAGWSTPPCSTRWRVSRTAIRRAPSPPTPTCPGRSPHPSSRRRTARRRRPRRARRSPRPSRSPTDEPTDEEAQLAASAAAWLERFKLLVGATPVLTLPYGDIDVSASIRNDRTRFDQAVARGAEVMAALALAVPADRGAGERPAEPRGRRRDAAGHDDPAGGQRLRHPARPARPPSSGCSGTRWWSRAPARRRAVPAPTASNDPLALRQRLLSEAALRLEAGRHRAAGRHPADGVARRGRRVVLHRPRAVVARPGPPRRRRRPHAQGRPCREPHLHRRRHRRRARSRGLLRGQPRRRGRHAAGAGGHPGDDHRGAGARRAAGHPLRAAPRATRAGRRRGRAGRGVDPRRPRQDRDRGTPRGHPLQRLRPPRRRPSSTASTSRSRCGCRCGPTAS